MVKETVAKVMENEVEDNNDQGMIKDMVKKGICIR